MIRLLADRPANVNFGQLLTESGASDINIVDGKIAGYWPDGEAPTRAEWQAIVSAHVPTPDPPTPEERIAELEAVIAALLEAP